MSDPRYFTPWFPQPSPQQIDVFYPSETAVYGGRRNERKTESAQRQFYSFVRGHLERYPGKKAIIWVENGVLCARFEPKGKEEC